MVDMILAMNGWFHQAFMHARAFQMEFGRLAINQQIPVLRMTVWAEHTCIYLT